MVREHAGEEEAQGPGSCPEESEMVLLDSGFTDFRSKKLL